MTSSPATTPPRVAMIARLFHPWIGGTERQALLLATSLRSAGVEVTVVTGRWFPGTPRRETIEGVPVVRNHTLWEFFGVRGLRKLGGYLYMLTLWLHLVRHRDDYDLFHVHGLNYHTFATVKAARRLGKPTIAKLANSGEASDIEKMRQDRQLALARFMLPTALQCDRFVALNPTVSSELVAAGVEPDRIVAIPNGVDMLRIEPRSDYRGSGTIRLLFVGRLHEQKSLDTLLRAVDLVRRGSSAIELVLVGQGPERAELMRLVAALGLDDVVTFAGPSDDVRRELAAADVFVLPSRAEGLSNALLEAMSAGLPAIVSDIPGNRDVITDEVDGLVFRVGDHRALADQLGRLIDDPSLRERLGRAARASVERNYGLDRVRDRYLEVYGELLAATARGVTSGAG